MAKLITSLLSFAQLTLVYSLPAGLEAPALVERLISEFPTQEPTTSYSTAIETLQSVTISVLPSITGVSMNLTY